MKLMTVLVEGWGGLTTGGTGAAWETESPASNRAQRNIPLAKNNFALSMPMKKQMTSQIEQNFPIYR
jgi:hypothetical protein